MKTQKNPKNSVKTIKVPRSALPLCCPSDQPNWLDQPLFAMHPRVYLPIETEGSVVCPYCGTQYYLDEDSSS
jgi:uncharacterized Zn-finger protein